MFRCFYLFFTRKFFCVGQFILNKKQKLKKCVPLNILDLAENKNVAKLKENLKRQLTFEDEDQKDIKKYKREEGERGELKLVGPN